MFKFSQSSENQLSQVHPDLQMIFREAIKGRYDFTVLTSTVRTIEDQKKFFEEGKTKTMDSKHLIQADGQRHAVDAWVYIGSVDWKKEKEQTNFANYVLGIADALLACGRISHKLKWGGDFSGDYGFTVKGDLPHFELMPK